MFKEPPLHWEGREVVLSKDSMAPTPRNYQQGGSPPPPAALHKVDDHPGPAAATVSLTSELPGRFQVAKVLADGCSSNQQNFFLSVTSSDRDSSYNVQTNTIH
jgi:hypothetical protein